MELGQLNTEVTVTSGPAELIQTADESGGLKHILNQFSGTIGGALRKNFLTFCLAFSITAARQ